MVTLMLTPRLHHHSETPLHSSLCHPPDARTRSPPRPETEAILQPHPKRTRRPDPSDYEYECARKQLSEFNESLPRRPLTRVKYEWANLMLDKQETSDSPGGSETDNVDEQDPTVRYHLGVHGIEVSCYEQEKEPVLDSNEDIRGTIQSVDCVTTNPSSSVSLKDYFDMIYSDVRVNDLRSSECLETIDMGGSSIIDKIEADDACREGGVLEHHGGCEDGECSGHSRGSQDMEIVGEHSGSRGFVDELGLDDASLQAVEREGENKDGNQEMLEAVDGQCSAQELQEPTHELVKPSSFDIKKKPCSQNIKKRLSTTNLDDGDDSLWSKTEPLEDSERFKQLVQNAFLNFVKALYETPSRQTKFTKQEGSTTLHCSVCCSNSKTFTSTHSLLQHAFMCRRAGLRAEHLGFHKAVCVLRGWNYEATPNGCWVRRILSNAEALAVKEDLIIWPPVVFVHNSSVTNANPEERMIVSIGKLKAVIKGMGFDRGMTKVSRGKAANHSIMVVNFHGTLSGLQEAEKLHKHYAENKRGRYEFQQIASRSNWTSDGSQKKDKIECILYGYLGIIEDLDKLDFTTKKQCVVKSKKEIHAIAGRPS